MIDDAAGDLAEAVGETVGLSVTDVGCDDGSRRNRFFVVLGALFLLLLIIIYYLYATP